MKSFIKDSYYYTYLKPSIDLFLKNVEVGVSILKLRHGKNSERNALITKDYITTGLTLGEVGKRYGVGRERVRQIVSKSLRILRHPHHKEMLETMRGEELKAEN